MKGLIGNNNKEEVIMGPDYKTKSIKEVIYIVK